MSFFKKITLTLAFVAGFLSPAMALADSYGIDAAATAAKLPKQVAGQSTVTGVVGSVVSVALSMISIVFFILILYAGFNWMIARGNTEAVEKSKGIIEGAVIGLIIVMAAYAITRFVFSSLDSGAPEAAAPTASVLPRAIIQLNPAYKMRIKKTMEIMERATETTLPTTPVTVDCPATCLGSLAAVAAASIP
jgi:hypothetical protein